MIDMAPRKPKPIVLPVVIGDSGMVFSLDERANARLRAQFVAACKAWPLGPAELELRPIEERRRVKQNNAYWYALGQCEKLSRDNSADDNWWTKDEWHVYFAQKYNGKVLSDLDPKTGEVTEIRVGLTTTKLSVEDFATYLDNVLFEIAERFGVVIEFEDAAKRGGRAA